MDKYDELGQEAKKVLPEEAATIVQLMIDMHKANREDVQACLAANETANKNAREAIRARRATAICAAICCALVLIMVGILALFATGLEVDMSTTTETITQDTEGEGNNVFQSGEYAQYKEAGADELNGETNSQENDQNP